MLLCYLITCPSLRPVDPWFSNSLHELHDSGGHVRESPAVWLGRPTLPLRNSPTQALGQGTRGHEMQFKRVP